jgi:hypothetical protein
MARRNVAELLQVSPGDHDIGWLHESLQWAVELEFATIPTYLSGMWSIKDPSSEAAGLIRSVVLEEMLHLGLVCNMIVGIGGTPQITAPVYPAKGLPGGVRPGLPVYLAGLTHDSVAMYMQIELPEHPLARAFETFPTIGAFYDEISLAFANLSPSISQANQIATDIFVTVDETLPVLTNVADVQTAIATIKDQGEGTSLSPDAPQFGGELAHYYRFGEIFHGQKLIPVDGSFAFAGAPVPFPDCFPVKQIPAGGYPDQAQVQAFDAIYVNLIKSLQSAWSGGGVNDVFTAEGFMGDLSTAAAGIVSTPLPDGTGNFGPDFVPANASGGAPPTGSTGAAVSFATDIVPLFTSMDVAHMRNFSVLLNDFAYMSQLPNAKDVLREVSSGGMPPSDSGEPRWTTEKVALFQAWIDGGLQP